MKIGVTGHRLLREPAKDWSWTRGEVDRILSQLPGPLVGVTSLAIGADQIFAESILRHQGSLEVIIPFATYEETFAEGQERQEYQRFLTQASRIEVLDKPGSDEEAYLQAGQKIVDGVDLLLAIWDGKPAVGLGGTGDIVNYADERGKRIIHLNPTTNTTRELDQKHESAPRMREEKHEQSVFQRIFSSLRRRRSSGLTS